MNRLSLEPDERMRWIYDPSHRDYNTDRAKHLREARSRAINSAPEYMRREAALNDALRNDMNSLPSKEGK